MPAPAPRAAAVAAMATTALLWLPLAGPASAHPFGDPQTLTVTRADDHTLELTWQAAADDLTSLALRLGLLDTRRTYVFRDGAMVPEESDADDAAVLADSPAFSTYLLERVVVAQGGTPCTGEVVSVSDLAGSGAVMEVVCPEPLDEVELRVQLLTDLHPAYRTLATGPGGATHVFSADSVSHAFRVAPGASAAASSPTARREGLTLVAWAGAGAAVLAAAAAVVRRRRSAA